MIMYFFILNKLFIFIFQSNICMCLCQNKFMGSQNFQRGLQVDIFPHLVGSCNQQSISVGSYRIIMKKKNTLLSFFVFLLSVPMREVTFTAILADFTSFLRDFFRPTDF